MRYKDDDDSRFLDKRKPKDWLARWTSFYSPGGDGYREKIEELRILAASGMSARRIGDQLGHSKKETIELCRNEGIAVRETVIQRNRGLRAYKAKLISHRTRSKSYIAAPQTHTPHTSDSPNNSSFKANDS